MKIYYHFHNVSSRPWKIAYVLHPIIKKDFKIKMSFLDIKKRYNYILIINSQIKSI